MINYLALLGWNPGNDDEIFDFNYLQENFSLDKVNKKSAVFDTIKLEWVSSQNIFKIPAAKLVDIASEFDPTCAGRAQLRIFGEGDRIDKR